MKNLLSCFFLLFSTLLFSSDLSFYFIEKNGKIKGKIVGADSKPIAYATVSLFSEKNEFVMGTISDDKGSFEFLELERNVFQLEIQFVGFQKAEKTCDVSSGNINLGTIKLLPDATRLDEVTVVAEKSQFEYRTDKKVFHVGKDLISQGGSAIDVLGQVPSVSVSPNGAVSLRGNSGVQILINGKRSGLTMNNALEAVPVNTIEKIEVVTNPSASFDASGSAGIINIILKKAVGEGLNGQIGAEVGAPANYVILPGINFRNDRLNLFSNLRFRYSDYNGIYKTDQEVTDSGVTTFLNQKEKEDRHDDGISGYFGGDYSFDEKHTVTLAYFRAQTKDTDTTRLDYELRRDDGFKNNIIRRGGSVENRNYNQIEFNFTKKFDRKGKKYTIDFQNDFWNSSKDWNINSTGDYLSSNIPDRLRTSNGAGSRDYMLKTDFVLPFKEKSKLETGIKAENRIVKNDYLAEAFDDGDWSTFAEINNDIKYTEKIAGGYLQYENSFSKIDYKIGLRSEFTAVDIRDDKGEFSDEKTYLNLFPSAFLTYKTNEKSTIGASYSRRINRPNLWNLYPFSEITDFNLQRVGNPNLKPAFADALELSYSMVQDEFSINSSVYFRYTKDEFGNFLERTPEEIFLYKPVNLEQSEELGIEVSGRYQPVKFVSFNTEFNFYRFREKGDYKDVNLDAEGNTWSLRINGDLSLPKGLKFQSVFNYQGARQSAQVERRSSYVLSFGLRKNFLNDRLSINLRAFNITDSRIIRSVSTGENFRTENSARRYGPRYSIGGTYRFNRSERMRLRRQRRGNR